MTRPAHADAVRVEFDGVPVVLRGRFAPLGHFTLAHRAVEAARAARLRASLAGDGTPRGDGLADFAVRYGHPLHPASEPPPTP